MPRQRFGLVLIASATITASLDYVLVTIILAVLGAWLVDA